MTDLVPHTELRRNTRVWVDGEGHVHVLWAVISDRDAVSFKLRVGKGRGNRDDLPWGIDRHSADPDPDGYTFGPNDCDLLPGGKCYSDGSALQAYELWREVVDGSGEERIWTVLEDRYARWVEDQEDPEVAAITTNQKNEEA